MCGRISSNRVHCLHKKCFVPDLVHTIIFKSFNLWVLHIRLIKGWYFVIKLLIKDEVSSIPIDRLFGGTQRCHACWCHSQWGDERIWTGMAWETLHRSTIKFRLVETRVRHCWRHRYYSLWRRRRVSNLFGLQEWPSVIWYFVTTTTNTRNAVSREIVLW